MVPGNAKKRVDQAWHKCKGCHQQRIHQYIVSLYSAKQILHSAQDDSTRRNSVRLAVRAELVEAHSPFDRLRANALNRTVLRLDPGVSLERLACLAFHFSRQPRQAITSLRMRLPRNKHTLPVPDHWLRMRRNGDNRNLAFLSAVAPKNPIGAWRAVLDVRLKNLSSRIIGIFDRVVLVCFKAGMARI